MKKRILSLLLVLMVIMSSSAFASTANIEKQRERARQRIAETPFVTYSEVMNNFTKWKGKSVHFKAKAAMQDYDKNFVVFLEDGDLNKQFLVGLLPYRFKMGEYYTVIGQVKDIEVHNSGRKAIMLLGETNYPILSEYGL